VKKKFLVGVLVAGVLAAAVGEAQALKRIVFKKGDYCGTYTGNYKRGQTFVLGLLENQRFVVRNLGSGLQTAWSVSGPTGEIEGSRVNRATLEYYTEADGDHFVYVTSTTTKSSVQFCAYSFGE
jgi:hypothetical protein